MAACHFPRPNLEMGTLLCRLVACHFPPYRTLFSDSLKLQLYQHRGQLNLLKVEVYLKPPHLNIALWVEWEIQMHIA